MQKKREEKRLVSMQLQRNNIFIIGGSYHQLDFHHNQDSDPYAHLFTC